LLSALINFDFMCDVMLQPRRR